jgi:hypothetical protein
MSVPLLNAVWEMPPGKLTKLERAVLARLAWAADDSGFNCWIGVKRLMACTEGSDRGVRNALATLLRDGYVTIEQPAAGHRTARRRLNVERIQPGYTERQRPDRRPRPAASAGLAIRRPAGSAANRPEQRQRPELTLSVNGSIEPILLRSKSDSEPPDGWNGDDWAAYCAEAERFAEECRRRGVD